MWYWYLFTVWRAKLTKIAIAFGSKGINYNRWISQVSELRKYETGSKFQGWNCSVLRSVQICGKGENGTRGRNAFGGGAGPTGWPHVALGGDTVPRGGIAGNFGWQGCVTQPVLPLGTFRMLKGHRFQSLVWQEAEKHLERGRPTPGSHAFFMLTSGIQNSRSRVTFRVL